MIYDNSKAKMTDTAALRRYMREEGIERSVACAFPFADTGLIRLVNDYILQASHDHEDIIPMVAVSLNDEEEAIGEARRCFAEGAKGVGEVAFYEKGLTPDALRGIEGVTRFVEESGKVFMLHVNEQLGHTYKGKAKADFNAVVDFIREHRNLTVILAHLGGGICFYEFMPEIREAFLRVYYDTAAAPFVYSDDIYGFVEKHLQERVLFGSDYPLLSLRRYLPALGSMGSAARARLLGGNAEDVFGRC